MMLRGGDPAQEKWSPPPPLGVANPAYVPEQDLAMYPNECDCGCTKWWVCWTAQCTKAAVGPRPRGVGLSVAGLTRAYLRRNIAIDRRRADEKGYD
jgi:hypothetical protein